MLGITWPFPEVEFVPTGGIGPSTLGGYLTIPAVAAVGGSWMVPRDRIAAGAFGEVRHLVEEAVARARDVPR